MKSTQFTALSLLATLGYASPLQGFEGGLVEKRQAPGPGNYFAITGATGGVHPRLELRDLEKTGEMWNLFLLAMTDFQAMDQKLINSWFQIAGIHGMPWTTWDGVNGNFTGREDHQMGYCPHNNQLFGTWHRPYLALFEQQLQTVATGIAAKFPAATRAKYQDAATKLRLPFWDWAKAMPASQPIIPTAMTNEQVQVTFPNGTAARIDNPLYDYDFHPLDNKQINGTGCQTRGTMGGVTGGRPDVCDNSLRTVRRDYPISNHPALDNKLRDILDDQRKKLLLVLSQYSTFDSVSSGAGSRCNGSFGRSGDLESLHNPIHVSNWPGHMSPPAVAAFDPMFWLHHATVDRQLALFQAIYPDSYAQPCEANQPTFTIERGEVLTADSPLHPFHRNKAGDFWTSKLVRDVKALGYTYPELAGNPSNASLIEEMKRQYSGPAQPASKKSKRQESGSKTETLYLADVTYPGYGLTADNGGSAPYNVLVFVGEVGSDPAEWTASESFVGVASALGGGSAMSADDEDNVKINLQDALDKAIKAGKTTEKDAVEYLKKNLHWRINIGDFEIDRSALPSIAVELVSTEVKLASSEGEFDQWVGDISKHGLVDV